MAREKTERNQRMYDLFIHGYTVSDCARWAGVSVSRATRIIHGKWPKGVRKHGETGYNHFGCRCEICRAANAAKQRQWFYANRNTERTSK